MKCNFKLFQNLIVIFCLLCVYSSSVLSRNNKLRNIIRRTNASNKQVIFIPSEFLKTQPYSQRLNVSLLDFWKRIHVIVSSLYYKNQDKLIKQINTVIDIKLKLLNENDDVNGAEDSVKVNEINVSQIISKDKEIKVELIPSVDIGMLETQVLEILKILKLYCQGTFEDINFKDEISHKFSYLIDDCDPLNKLFDYEKSASSLRFDFDKYELLNKIILNPSIETLKKIFNRILKIIEIRRSKTITHLILEKSKHKNIQEETNDLIKLEKLSGGLYHKRINKDGNIDYISFCSAMIKPGQSFKKGQETIKIVTARHCFEEDTEIIYFIPNKTKFKSDIPFRALKFYIEDCIIPYSAEEIYNIYKDNINKGITINNDYGEIDISVNGENEENLYNLCADHNIVRNQLIIDFKITNDI